MTPGDARKYCCSVMNASVVDACSPLDADKLNMSACMQAVDRSEAVGSPEVQCFLQSGCQIAG